MAEFLYPIPKFHFEVSWTDVTINCSEVSGLNAEVDVIEYRDGKSENFYPTKRPGLQRFGDITLRKAIFESDEDLQEWFQKVVERDDNLRETVTIILKNELHEAVMTWVLENAWIRKYQMPEMNALSNEAAIESIVVVAENIVQEFA